MSWQLRHEGSPQVLQDLTLQQIVDGLRDGDWETTDEVLGPGDKDWCTIEAHPQLAEIAEEVALPPPVRHEDPSSIDMNALIDVCLVLLIFYMITATFTALVQRSVPLPLASSDAKGRKKIKLEDVKVKMIRVVAYHDDKGKPVVLVENQNVKDVLASDGTIDAEKIRDALRPHVKAHKQEVLLDARDITWENTIRIQDGARDADVKTVHHLMKK